MRKFGSAVLISAMLFPSIMFAEESEDVIESPVAIYKVTPTHPEELYQQGIEGHATIVITVDTFGSVIDPMVDTASHEEFGLAAMLAASEWIFEPATKNGVPIEIKAKLPFVFSITFEHMLNVEMEREVFKKLDTKITPSSELDKPPLPTFVPAFVDFYPQQFRDTGKSASISIEFIIAPDGMIHNPRIISISTEGFEEAAIRAVSHMKYKPILVKGDPAYVSMAMPIQMSE